MPRREFVATEVEGRPNLVEFTVRVSKDTLAELQAIAEREGDVSPATVARRMMELGLLDYQVVWNNTPTEEQVVKGPDSESVTEWLTNLGRVADKLGSPGLRETVNKLLAEKTNKDWR